MKCPKCDIDIKEEMLVCPNCKKVLKLVCPKCKTVNKTNTCKKCGFVIVSKCHKCGKINQTINSKCSKCGFSTYTSVAINSSNIDEFACLTIEFPNLADIKSALGSTKLTDKFKTNLDHLISSYANSIGVTREIFEDIYIIRFNKDDSFRASANNAMKATIEIQNLITELNFKLNKLKNTTLQCKIAVLKRDIYSKPQEYKSGFDIKLIYQGKNTLKLLRGLQVITDAAVYEQVCDNFELSSLSSTFIKNEMVMFFELNLKKYVKIPKPKEDEEEPIKVDKLNIFEDEVLAETDASDKIYNVDSINFDELKCTFKNIKTLELVDEILDQFKENRKKIVSVKTDKEYFTQTGILLTKLQDTKIFKNIFRVTCYDEMKYKPYGFFHELISSIYNFTQSTKYQTNNNFEMFEKIDPSGFIKDLMNLNTRTFPHPEDVRYSLFDIFYNIVYSMSQSLIYIENFEKIDDTSQEVLQLFLEKFNNLDVSYLTVTNKELPLHKRAHFLLANPDYVEINVKPAPFKQIIEKVLPKYENILDSYYMKQIAQNAKGNILYFKNSIEYLLEKELLSVEEGKFKVENFENIMIPQNLDELITKRAGILSKDKDAYKMFSMLLLIGPAVDLDTIKYLYIPNIAKAIQTLSDKKYIYIYNDTIYIQNYNLYKTNFISSMPFEFKQSIAQELLQKLFDSTNKNTIEAGLYKILEEEKKEFIVWEKLSTVNASLGDFSAYLNCSIKFLKLLENHINESSEKTIEEYKMEVYENISNLLYKYTPNEIYNITQIILSNLEKNTDDKKIINLCNKMLQGCLIGGNYSHALELVHKILSRFSNASLSPQDSNFNIAFFLISLVKIEVLFSIGNLKDCVDAGEEILNVLTPSNLSQLKPEHLSNKQFEETIFDTMSFVALSKIVLLQSEEELVKFIEKIETNIGRLTQSFELFILLGKLIKGDYIELPQNINEDDDKFSKIILNIIKAFTENQGDYKKFADKIYQAKISAKMHKLSQIELFCDLLIGYSYFKLKQYNKTASIYYNALDTSTQNGLKTITYLDWYFISMLKFEQNDSEVAFGVANNAIVQLEKDSNSGDLLFYLFSVLLSKIFASKNEEKQAELCMRNAEFIKKKYGLNFEITQSIETSQSDEIGEIS